MEQMHDFRMVSTNCNCYSASLLKSRAGFHLTQKGGLVIRGLLPHAFRTSYKCISRFHRARSFCLLFVWRHFLICSLDVLICSLYI